MWRYREAIPIISNKNMVTFNEGFTPIVDEQFYGRNVIVKQDHLFPSGSFKDRGASVLISKIKELGVKKVVEDSSGNAGAAIASYCAKASIDCHIFIPKKTSSEKLQQIKYYGAHLHTITGTREDTARATWQKAKHIYYASHYWNPYFFQGTKTFIFELVEQLGWKIPDCLFIPVGNGTLLYGTFIGLQELKQEGIIDTYPKIIGVQSENCSPLEYMLKNNTNTPEYYRKKETIAEGIAIENPVRAKEILRSIQQTQGDIIVVNEREILEARSYVKQKGYYIEPTSAVALAGFKKFPFMKNKQIIVPFTGHGLKTKQINKESQITS